MENVANTELKLKVEQLYFYFIVNLYIDHFSKYIDDLASLQLNTNAYEQLLFFYGNKRESLKNICEN